MNIEGNSFQLHWSAGLGLSVEPVTDLVTPKHLLTKQAALWRWLILTIMLSFAFAGSFAYGSADTAQYRGLNGEQAIRLSELTSGELLMRPSEPLQNNGRRNNSPVLNHDAPVLNHYSPALSQSTEVEIDVEGMVARVRVRQSFVNHTQQWQEGLYAFPLPDNAAVNEMRIRIADRLIEGTVQERQQAKKTYQRAVQAGKTAALVEQQRPNLFTQSIANIAPGEKVSVDIVYLQTVHYDSGTFSIRFPTTFTPRYFPGSVKRHSVAVDAMPRSNVEGNSEQANEQEGVFDGWGSTFDSRTIDKSRPSNVFNLHGSIDIGLVLESVGSAYHNISLSRHNTRYAFDLKNEVSVMNKDVELHWRPESSDAPRAMVFTENRQFQSSASDDYKKQSSQAQFAQLMVLPPSTAAQGPQLAKEQIFIIDTSGSMGGASIEQAKTSLIIALDKLNAEDYFNIVEFNSESNKYSPYSLKASPTHIAQAKRMVQRLVATGGTEMLLALRDAFSTGGVEQSNENLVRQVVFITDGAVGNEAALFRFIKNNLGPSRLFTVGIGSAPNTHFMRKAAQFGRGSFTHIGKTSEISEKIGELISKLRRPVLSNISIDWPQSVEAYPTRVPDLYAGEPILVNVRLSAELSAEAQPVHVSGQLAGKHWSSKLALDLVNTQAKDKSSNGISVLWARAKISSLLDSRITGKPESEVRPVVLATALKYQLLSPYTSFVAVENRVRRPVDVGLARSQIANNKPAGHALKVHAYPQGATGAKSSLVWAILLLVMLSVLKLACRSDNVQASLRESDDARI